jgi:16S rRNA (cytosine967-C5)-methyltransferase
MALSARAAALDVVTEVLRRKRPLDEALEGNRDLSRLDDRDRGFARLLAATTLRRLGQIDDVLGRFLERPLPYKAAAAHDILRLGTAQLLFLGTPAHAAVATAVELAKDRNLTAHKNLVNAVLRRVDREGRAIGDAQDAARLNLPEWMWRSWCAAYGEVTVRAIAAAHLLEPPLDVSVKGDPAAWAERLGAELLPTGSLRRAGGGAVPELEGYGEGAWWIQDAAAALPVRLLGDMAGSHVVDLCAAPGGKTCQLAAAGAAVTAVDRSDKRLQRVRANLDRLGLHAELVAADAAAWQPERQPDAVLLDAPCSATGTLRRHPDIAWLKGEADVLKLAEVQFMLLRSAARMLRPRGILVYCVCSLQPEEGPAVIARALAEGLPLRRVPVRAEEVGGLAELLTGDGDVRTLPSHLAERGGMDGFYACRLERL